MKTIFPAATGFSGKLLVGARRHPGSEAAEQVGAFVLKRLYRLSGSSLIPEEDATGIRMADELITVAHEGNDYQITDYESDLAVFKPLADVIVRGHYSASQTCRLQVTPPGSSAQLWFSRSGGVPDYPDLGITDLDAGRNMFGWELRQVSPRKDLAVDSDDNPPASAPVFSNLFFNAYRRAFAQGGFPASQLPSGARITIERGAQTLHFQLGTEQVRCHLSIHDGISPDKPRFWCRHAMTPIRLDTLVVSPDINEVYTLWRGTWPYDHYPADRYRQLEVTVEELNG